MRDLPLTPALSPTGERVAEGRVRGSFPRADALGSSLPALRAWATIFWPGELKYSLDGQPVGDAALSQAALPTEIE